MRDVVALIDSAALVDRLTVCDNTTKQDSTPLLLAQTLSQADIYLYII